MTIVDYDEDKPVKLTPVKEIAFDTLAKPNEIKMAMKQSFEIDEDTPVVLKVNLTINTFT